MTTRVITAWIFLGTLVLWYGTVPYGTVRKLSFMSERFKRTELSCSTLGNNAQHSMVDGSPLLPFLSYALNNNRDGSPLLQ